ncbi:MAG: urease accessory protein UreF [Rhodoferax sp.]|jgi:urease accessory protein|nr:urease accessory protein UreF [Rhodoferax sp.]
MTQPLAPGALAQATPLSPASLLQLIWLASPALPVGGFSYSEVLEAAVDRAGVDTEAAATAWLRDQLHLTLARSDLPVLAQAIVAWRTRDLPRVRALNDWVLHSRESSELRLQNEQMGRSLMDWLRVQHAADADVQAASRACSSPVYPVAFALAASLTTASAHDCLLSFAFGWAENMTQAAVKAVPLGQSAGQRMLAMLATEIPVAVAHALRVQDADRQAYSPMLAILSAQHETQYSRLFRS